MATTTSSHKCKICGEEPRSLARHVREVHGMDPADYYRRYVDPNAGRCVVCGRPTKFINLAKGFRKTCSERCLQQTLGRHRPRAAAHQERRCRQCRHFVLKFLPNDGWLQMFKVTNASPPITAHVCLVHYRLAKADDAACAHFATAEKEKEE